MNLTSVVDMLRGGIGEIIILVSPVLLAGLVVGLIVAIVQAATSIQETTLTFLPKFIVILVMIALLGSWIFARLGFFTTQIFNQIPDM
jgi:flagellar biosynthetic protein FliQ